MSQCLQCNAGLPAGAKFCGRCGAAVQASEPGSSLTTPATFAPPSPPPAAPSSNPIWASSDPVQGAGGTEQISGQAQQWGTGPAQQWGAGQQGQQWGPPAPAYPGAVRQKGGTPGPAIAAGAIAIVGALAIIGACALPVTTNTVGFGSTGSSVSLFKELSNGTAWWYLVEPIGVAVLALVAGVVVMVSRSRLLPVVAAGVLIGFGIQTVFLFLGYWRGFGSGQHAGPAGVVGILAGLLLAVAGMLAATVRRA